MYLFEGGLINKSKEKKKIWPTCSTHLGARVGLTRVVSAVVVPGGAEDVTARAVPVGVTLGPRRHAQPATCRVVFTDKGWS